MEAGGNSEGVTHQVVMIGVQQVLDHFHVHLDVGHGDSVSMQWVQGRLVKDFCEHRRGKIKLNR